MENFISSAKFQNLVEPSMRKKFALRFALRVSKARNPDAVNPA